MGGVTWFGILGPLEVTASGRPVPIVGRSQRELLTLLLLNANQTVYVDSLIESTWPDRLPDTARKQLQNAVGRLRRTLVAGGIPVGVLETRPRGYRLNVSSDELDALAFHQQVHAGRQAEREQRRAEAVARLRSALALWRGQPLADIDNHLVVAKVHHLQEQQVAVLEECLRLELRQGRHHEVVGELSVLVDEHPLRERLCALLMLALYRDGRTAEALDAYRRVRTAFVTELGLEPGVELRNLEQAVLTGDSSLDLPVEPGLAGVQLPRPRQLPPAVADFVGRDGLSADIEGMLCRGDTAGVVVVSIAGQAGVGKTALAVHVAHRLSDAFPDGQLYVNLRGGGQAYRAEPAEVLARFLRALGAGGLGIPQGLEERAEDYRSRLADQRVLVVLDNAVDEAQVQLLIPGARGCAVLITSRSKLAGLPGARLVELDALEPGQAIEMLSRIVGVERVTAEFDAARELVRLCRCLPLALRISGARLVVRSRWTIGDLAGRLADENRRLDELTYGDLEVRASLSLSYQRLSPRSRQLLQMLSRLYAPDFTTWVGAALLDTSLAEAEELFDELVDIQLLESSGSAGPHYALHDLTRLFAREHLVAEPRAALARALGGWLALAERAHIVLSGGDFATLHGTAPRWPLAVEGMPDAIADDPLAWYDAERTNIVMAVRQAADAGLDELCWDLVASSYALFLTRAHNDEWEDTLRCALACTRQVGNPRGTAVMLMGLGLLGAYRHQYAEAAVVLDESVRTFRDIGETRGLVYALGVAAHVDGMLGRYDQAVARHEEALQAHRVSGDRGAEMLLLRSLSQLLVEIGRFEEAEPYLDQALETGRGGDPRVRAEVLYWLGQLHLGRGRVDDAEALFKEMLGIAEELRDPREEAEARYGLGLVRLESGAYGAATGLLRQALALNGPLGEPLTDGRIRVALGRVHHRNGEPEQAIGHLTEAVRIFGAITTPLWEARAVAALGDVYAGRGDHAAARPMWDRARALFAEVGSPEADRF